MKQISHLRTVCYLMIIFAIIGTSAGCIDSQQTADNSGISNQIDANNQSNITTASDGAVKWQNPDNSPIVRRIAMNDSRVQQLLAQGGEIVGVFLSCHPTPAPPPDDSGSGGSGCAPALRIRYNEVTVDFLVDTNNETVVETVIEVPSGSSVDSSGDKILVTRHGEVILTLDSDYRTIRDELNYTEGELNFTVTPEKVHMEEGERFKINLTLTNRGDNKVNVWKLEEQVSYEIIFYKNGMRIPYMCGVIERIELTDEYLVKLNPGESIKHTQDSNCWELSRGEYSLRAIYNTQLGERITKPYWVGRIETEAVTISIE